MQKEISSMLNKKNSRFQSRMYNGINLLMENCEEIMAENISTLRKETDI